MNKLMHRVRVIARNWPNLLRGYNIYANPEKFRLIDRAFRSTAHPRRSFADLGGVWKVNGAYTRYTLNTYPIDRAVIVDTDYTEEALRALKKSQQLGILHADFSSLQTIERIGRIDCVFFFDVLLHQAAPHWHEVLSAYAAITDCMLIYNQQFVAGEKTVRLTDLPLDQYMALAPSGESRHATYRHVYAHRNEIHQTFGKPWKDIHNIFQWGITDRDLRSHMDALGYAETYYRNHGQFSDLPAFENHAFLFERRNAVR